MNLTAIEKIKVIMGRRDMSLANLSSKLGQSRQNLSNKMSRGNFSEKDLQKIAAALDCTYKACFVLNDTGEEV